MAAAQHGRSGAFAFAGSGPGCAGFLATPVVVSNTAGYSQHGDRRRATVGHRSRCMCHGRWHSPSTVMMSYRRCHRSHSNSRGLRGPRPISVLKNLIATRSHGGGSVAMPHHPSRCIWPTAITLPADELPRPQMRRSFPVDGRKFNADTSALSALTSPRTRSCQLPARKQATPPTPKIAGIDRSPEEWIA